MNLISILLALAVELFYKPIQSWRRFDWFYNYTDTLNAKFSQYAWRDGPLGVLLVIGPVVFGVSLLHNLLGGISGLFGFVFGIGVLLMSLGPKDLVYEVEALTAAMKQDDPAALRLAAEPILAEHAELADEDLPTALQSAILLEANRRVFGVLLWFMLLGPVGAALFRLSSELMRQHPQQDGFSKASCDLYRILIWLPSRFLVMGFALAGSFVHTLGHLDSMNDLWREESEKLIVDCGLGAVSHGIAASDADPGEGIVQAIELVKRTLMVWLAALSLLILSGWAF